MKREHRLKMAEEALERAAQQLEGWAGPCYQCRWWRSLHHPSDNVTDFDRCTNPVVLAERVDLVKGMENREVRCTYARGEYGLCGPKGELFELDSAWHPPQADGDDPLPVFPLLLTVALGAVAAIGILFS